MNACFSPSLSGTANRDAGGSSRRAQWISQVYGGPRCCSSARIRSITGRFVPTMKRHLKYLWCELTINVQSKQVQCKTRAFIPKTELLPPFLMLLLKKQRQKIIDSLKNCSKTTNFKPRAQFRAYIYLPYKKGSNSSVASRLTVPRCDAAVGRRRSAANKLRKTCSTPWREHFALRFSAERAATGQGTVKGRLGRDSILTAHSEAKRSNYSSRREILSYIFIDAFIKAKKPMPYRDFFALLGLAVAKVREQKFANQWNFLDHLLPIAAKCRKVIKST